MQNPKFTEKERICSDTGYKWQKKYVLCLKPRTSWNVFFVFFYVHFPQIKCHYFRSVNKIIRHLQRAHTDAQLHTDSMVPLADKANLVGWFDADTAWMLIDYYYSTLSREDNLEQSIHKMEMKSKKKKKSHKNNYLPSILNPATLENSFISAESRRLYSGTVAHVVTTTGIRRWTIGC